MEIIDVYDEVILEYIGSFENTNQNIIDYVAELLPFENRRLIDYSSDEIVLTTIGNFLNYVPDQLWLEEIRPLLIAKQTGEVSTKKVKLFDRYEQENEGF
ncbi:hypothetical protein DQ184_12965 [Enterococcus faecium]|uniref:hypothetical protein n=1 Tax=Enterococcus faecium TaxID=1352 RepID=UPI000CF2E7E8|nr:hypothetical protein [Enterococcus faecium]EGP4917816.1 hypothetical protein [Enterococcus faecium]EGP5338754.1 hypothetical protein [Enterococcus faecium]EGP5747259.1 hypothetical protein [Enterococcus faecium]EME3506729.1 hypothetical protein [Enterococcus faecium]EMF0334127.1 hypothetical protein [Enterococcus faecium]